MPEILLLDDDPLQLKLLSRTLHGLGYTDPIACDSAEAALQALSAPHQAIGLILLDLNMPGVDGVAFLKLLSERRFDAAVVLVSGEDERLIESAARFGASQNIRMLGAISKPVLPAELKTVLEHWQKPTAAPAPPKQYPADQIARAILENELVPHFQPIVNLVTGALAGAETLVRWQHPSDGLVMPGQFIAVAEERGLIRDITRLMIRAAVTQGRVWRDQGLHVFVAVNVSMGDLTRADFADFVLDALERSGLPPDDLVLEASEQRVAQDPDTALAAISRLRMRRITMAIDNFGIGSSSLAQLRDIPFNAVKVDGSFVHGAGGSAVLGAIVNSSIDLARQLGMRTVAEGVEDSTDWVWLRSSGCEMAQGWFIGAPMAASELAAWLTAWEKRRRRLFDA
ncbi:MAG: EAL domain-containing response regulator [Gemmatimonadetes bacterium]|nr:EAL domain-containing response regulator [Gemmatimonadota bacterium]